DRRHGDVDVARPGGDDEHLAEADDHQVGGEGEGEGDGLPAALAGDGEDDRPDERGGREAPDPRPGQQRARVHRRVLPSTARPASTARTITPCTADCMLEATSSRLRTTLTRPRVTPPIAAPIGTARPPENEPPPRITAATVMSV